jgi:hypothetical protein
MVRDADFDRTIPLPPGLTIAAVKAAVKYVEKELAELVELYFEQANVFSALVGIFAAKALDANSVYEKNRNVDLAQQRFPDLKRKGSGPNPKPGESLECKASKRPWAVQAHYNHAGWYIVFRYLVDPTTALERGRPVIIWRVDVAFVEKTDWKYEGSTAGTSGGGRTHTFGLVHPAEKLKGKAAYERADVKVSGGKAVPRNGG